MISGGMKTILGGREPITRAILTATCGEEFLPEGNLAMKAWVRMEWKSDNYGDTLLFEARDSALISMAPDVTSLAEIAPGTQDVEDAIYVANAGDAATLAASFPRSRKKVVVREDQGAYVALKLEEPSMPKFPTAMKKTGHQQSRVKVRVIVNDLGKVEDACIVERADTGFEEAALEAARKYTFTAARYHGQDVSSWIDIPFVFKGD